MRETIKKGMIECAWFSTWCSHAEEYGFKEHGGFGGCAIEHDHADVLPRIPNDSRLEEHADPIISASCARCALPEEIERTRSGGKLPAFSNVGGYPLFYVNKDGETFCSACADDRHHHVTDVDVNYENESLYCDDCNAKIDSAYGESDESEES